MMCILEVIDKDDFSITDILSSITVCNEDKLETIIIKETYLTTNDQVVTFFSEKKSFNTLHTKNSNHYNIMYVSKYYVLVCF